jgi:hypothetical protein
MYSHAGNKNDLLFYDLADFYQRKKAHSLFFQQLLCTLLPVNDRYNTIGMCSRIT